MEHDQPEIERRLVGESAWDTLLRAAVAAEFPAMPGEDPADLSEWVRSGSTETTHQLSRQPAVPTRRL